MGVVVYGASDDLIEVEGDVTEEFLPDKDEDSGTLLAFSNGTVIRVSYSPAGVWRISPVAGAENVVVVQAPEDDEDNYSDRATVTSDVTWVVAGNQFARNKGR